ncbi:eya transcriptional coactivator and phosphatase 2 [Dermatophagoides pteronyssinus]|uniref:eya transcriptional coactivator and phosphatase 2 n=1 Tax=Dermatophagoides pteronyssinus TaxID=6956 RepID=UPI003F67D141
MNAYQLPSSFNTGPAGTVGTITPTTSPFNYFQTQNNHHHHHSTYGLGVGGGIISTSSLSSSSSPPPPPSSALSYDGNLRSATTTTTNDHFNQQQQHKMTTNGQSPSASFMSTATYFPQPHHHHHLHQPFTFGNHHHQQQQQNHPHHSHHQLPTHHHHHHSIQQQQQSATINGTNPYSHNHYSAYTTATNNNSGSNSSPTNMVPSLNHFDYNSGTNINGGTTSTTSSSATAAAASSSSSYPYIGCTGNYPTSYSPFATLTSLPQPSSLSSQHQQQQQNHQTSTLISAAVASTAAASSNENDDNNNGGISSSSYQTNSETYLTNLCNNNRMNGDNNNDDLYTLNVHKNDSNLSPIHSLPPIKKAKRTSRGRQSRRQSSMLTNNNNNSHHPNQSLSSGSPSPENNIDRIFIWYIDETILSYLNVSEYNRFSGFNDSLTASLYNEIFIFINKFAEKYLFLSDLKDIDQSHIDDSAADDNGQDLSNYNFHADGFKTSVSCNSIMLNNGGGDLRQKMALRYRKINEIYSNFGDKIDELMDKDDYEQLEDLIKRFDLFSKNWIHSAMKTLSFIKTRSNCLNVLISSSPLIYTLTKLLIFQLGPYFSIGNIYSCSKTSKEHTLNRVLNRFGSNCTYIVVGKGSDEQQLSQKLELPFWPINEREHFESLLNAMHYIL